MAPSTMLWMHISRTRVLRPVKRSVSEGEASDLPGSNNVHIQPEKTMSKKHSKQKPEGTYKAVDYPFKYIPEPY